MLRATMVALVTAALASGCIGVAFDGGEGAGGWAPVTGPRVGPDASVAEAQAFTRDQIRAQPLESVSCRGPFPLHDGDTAACTARYHEDGAACSETHVFKLSGARLMPREASEECAALPETTSGG